MQLNQHFMYICLIYSRTAKIVFLFTSMLNLRHFVYLCLLLNIPTIFWIFTKNILNTITSDRILPYITF